MTATQIPPPIYFNVKSYGATGNGSTDDSLAVQAAIDAARDTGRGGAIFYPPGTYSCKELLTYSNVGHLGAGWSSILKQRFEAGDNKYLMSVNPGSGGTANPADNVANIAFQNMQFLGTVAADAFMEHVFLLNLNAVSKVRVEGCCFTGFRGDAIYLGSGNSGGIERHNQDVKITGCHFDGVNNDNRNAISVIDGDGILIRGNSFINCTRSNMPGAIDFEPNNAVYGVIRDIEVSENVFDNIGGNAGVVGMLQTTAQASLTVPTQGITISDNIIRNSDSALGFYFQQQQTPNATTIRSDIEIRGNTLYGVDQVGEFEGIAGIRFLDNVVNTSQSALVVGFANTCYDVHVAGNVFSQIGQRDGGVITLINGTLLHIRRNIFHNCGASGGGFGNILNLTISGGTGSTSQIRFTDNEIIPGTLTTAVAAKNVSHTTTPTTNVSLNNITALTISSTVFNQPNNVNLLGGAITGGSGSFSEVDVDGSSGTSRDLQFQTVGNSRWIIRANTSTESGSDAGSNLDIISRTDGGAQKTVVLSFVRQSGAIIVADGTNLALGATNGTVIGTGTTQKIGFYGGSAQAKAAVTGSRGGNAALASLLTTLAAFGLITDSTSA